MSSAPPSTRAELVRLRIAAGLSQQQLAKILGASSGRVVRGWESGRFAPRVDQLPRLARALGVPVEAVVEAIVGRDAEDLKSAQATEDPAPDPFDAIDLHLREAARLVRGLRGASEAPAKPETAPRRIGHPGADGLGA